MKLCIDCKHYDPEESVCRRILEESYSLVTGEKMYTRVNRYCEFEREKISKIVRFLGNNQCGEDGIHFEPK